MRFSRSQSAQRRREAIGSRWRSTGKAGTLTVGIGGNMPARLGFRGICVLTALFASLCSCRGDDEPARSSVLHPHVLEAQPEADQYRRLRDRMVREQIVGRGLRDARVLAAMRRVPRHEFVPRDVRAHSYEDRPLPIGYDQTISQPYVVALMTSLLELEPDDRVLEIGTGSGYQAAILSVLSAEVYSIEIVAPLAMRAARDLERLGFANVHVRAGDGYAGWPEHEPFDAIIVTAAPPRVPEPLKQQLAVGGRLVVPVGEAYQTLRIITRTDAGFTERVADPVRFVPMTGRVERER